MNQKRVLLGFITAVIALNLGGAVLYRMRKGSGSEAPAAVIEPNASAQLAEGKQRRKVGLAALEAGDYEKALINLTEAKTLLGPEAAVDDLLKVTAELRDRRQQGLAVAAAGAVPGVGAVPAAGAGPAVGAPAVGGSPLEAQPAVIEASPVLVAPAVAPAPTRPVRSPPRAAPRPAPVERERVVASLTPPPPAPAERVLTGLILVSTTPRGLLVQVDGVSVDLTPVRTSAKVGSHRVALLDGDHKLFETMVEVEEGAVATVVKDLTVELAPKPAPVVEKPAPVAVATPAPTPPPPPPPVAAAPVAVAAVAGKGGLTVTSPGLYAEVWINGRPYGFPPVEVRDLPAGPAKIDVRVNGAVKRTATVTVVAGELTPVKVR